MKPSNLDIYWTARYDYERGGQLSLHSHDFYQMIYFIYGSGVFTINNADYPIQPKTLFIIKPHQQHGFRPLSNQKHKNLTMDLKFQIHDPDLKQIVQELSVSQATSEIDIKDFMEQIRNEGMDKKSFYADIAALKLTELFYKLARLQTKSSKSEHSHANASLSPTNEDYSAIQMSASSQSSIPLSRSSSVSYEPHEALKELQSFLEQHYADTLTWTDISRHLSYSQHYLSQLFRDQYGCTLSWYIRKLRIQKAKELISNTTLSLKAVAEQVGFKTIHHFTRVFKEFEGITPGEWKSKEQQGIKKDIYFD